VSEDEFPEDEIWDKTTSEDPGIRADALIDLGHLKIQQEDFALAKSLFGSATDVCQRWSQEPRGLRTRCRSGSGLECT
jgi:hypothetical protein